jgi:hypothetical protein
MDQIPKTLIETYAAANTLPKKKTEICKASKYLNRGECIDISNVLASNGYKNNIKFSNDGGNVDLDTLPQHIVELLYSTILNKINTRAI